MSNVKKQRQWAGGFTLVELLVALMVSSVVLSAVATLAYATSSASEATDDMGREQAQLRQVSMRVGDLIKRSNRVYRSVFLGAYAFEWGVKLCHDLNGDRDYNDTGETVWVYRSGDYLRILGQSDERYTQCENPTFKYGYKGTKIRTVNIWFDVDENGQTQRRCINARLRAVD